MTTLTVPWIAEIPLLDWTGPRFLGFYVLALLVVTIWCWRRARRSLGRYERQDVTVEDVDDYESAYLAAGPPRVAQVAVMTLLFRGLVIWKPAIFGARLVKGETPGLVQLPMAEKELLDQVNQAGSKGLAVKNAARAVAPAMRGIEVSLATKGLRPTKEERGNAGLVSVTPLIALGVLGLFKLVIGIARDKPVMFLVMLLFLTFIVTCIVHAQVPRLTAAGEALLANLRGRNEARRRASSRPDEYGPDLVSGSVALFGPVALASMPIFAPIHGELENLHAKAAAASGSGCSSGCGTGASISSGGDGGGGGDSGGSGCGGGGCGGCGGGGGD